MGRNSRSFDTRTHEELVELGRRAGIASGAARRKKAEAIRQERIHDEAMRRQMTENIMTVRASARMLLEAQRIAGGK